MKKLLVAMATAIVAVGAQADVVPFTFNAPAAPTSFGTGTTAPALVGTLGTFDTSLGTLTGISLTLNGFMDTIITATATTDSRFNTATFVDMTFGSSIAGLNAVLAADIMSLTAGPAGVQSLAATNSATYGSFTDADTASYGATLAALFSSLSTAGPGTFNILCNAEAGMNNTIRGGNVDLSQRTNAGCSGTIEYTYTKRTTAVPEPTSLALVGLALAGVGAVSRRRKA